MNYFTCSVVSYSLRPHGLQRPRLLCHGILQERALERVDIPSSRGSSRPRDRTHVSCVAGGLFHLRATREVRNLQIRSVVLYVAFFTLSTVSVASRRVLGLFSPVSVCFLFCCHGQEVVCIPTSCSFSVFFQETDGFMSYG